jgi:hypothetical protein
MISSDSENIPLSLSLSFADESLSFAENKPHSGNLRKTKTGMKIRPVE